MESIKDYLEDIFNWTRAELDYGRFIAAFDAMQDDSNSETISDFVDAAFDLAIKWPKLPEKPVSLEQIYGEQRNENVILGGEEHAVL